MRPSQHGFSMPFTVHRTLDLKVQVSIGFLILILGDAKHLRKDTGHPGEWLEETGGAAPVHKER